MSPSTRSFSAVTSSTTSPRRTVELDHSVASSIVDETTYLGTTRSRSAHSPGRSAHRVANQV